MRPVGQALIRSLRRTGGAEAARPARPTDPMQGTRPVDPRVRPAERAPRPSSSQWIQAQPGDDSATANPAAMAVPTLRTATCKVAASATRSAARSGPRPSPTSTGPPANRRRRGARVTAPAQEGRSYRNGRQDRELFRPHELGFKPPCLTFAVSKLRPIVSHNQPPPSDTVADDVSDNFKMNFLEILDQPSGRRENPPRLSKRPTP
jgi:hypothetical protein